MEEFAGPAGGFEFAVGLSGLVMYGFEESVVYGFGLAAGVAEEYGSFEDVCAVGCCPDVAYGLETGKEDTVDGCAADGGVLLAGRAYTGL